MTPSEARRTLMDACIEIHKDGLGGGLFYLFDEKELQIDGYVSLPVLEAVVVWWKHRDAVVNAETADAPEPPSSPG